MRSTTHGPHFIFFLTCRIIYFTVAFFISKYWCMNSFKVSIFTNRWWPWHRRIFRSSHREVFCKKGALRNSAKFTWKHLCQSLFFNKKTLVQGFSCEFSQISNNTFSYKTAPVAASRSSYSSKSIKSRFNSSLNFKKECISRRFSNSLSQFCLRWFSKRIKEITAAMYNVEKQSFPPPNTFT